MITSDTDDLEEGIEEFVARSDDGYWSRFVRDTFSWPRFTTWWIARRFVVPRDIRKR